MGPSQKVLTLVGSHQFFVAQGRVSLSWFGFEFGKFPLKMLNFLGQKIFWVRTKSTLVKGRSTSYLLRVKSKLGSGQVLSLVQTKVSHQEMVLKIFSFLGSRHLLQATLDPRLPKTTKYIPALMTDYTSKK